jgi:hypothetical protein
MKCVRNMCAMSGLAPLKRFFGEVLIADSFAPAFGRCDEVLMNDGAGTC